MLAFDTVVRIEEPHHALLVVDGDLDLMTVQLFSGAALSVLDQTDAAVVRLDLRGVGFVDSTGVEALLKLDRDVRGRGGTLEVVGSSSYVERVLNLAGLGDLFV